MNEEVIDDTALAAACVRAGVETLRRALDWAYLNQQTRIAHAPHWDQYNRKMKIAHYRSLADLSEAIGGARSGWDTLLEQASTADAEAQKEDAKSHD